MWLAVGFAVALAAAGTSLMNPSSESASRTDEAPDATRRADGVVADRGVYRPSEAQWASLKVAVVRQVAFRDERATDGKIAINEATTTPVFSPYSGRVTRLIALPGDHVERGAPMFAIEAAEFVQGHHELIVAAAASETAQAKLGLARTIEKRQRELMAIRGGATKDYEQARSDLVTAQTDERATQIALAAARHRLRILGCSEDELARLEKLEHTSAEALVYAPIGGTVIQRKVGVGQYINVGAADPVFTVGDLSTVWLVASVRESDASYMKLGAPVEVVVLAYPGRVFNAKLDYIASALDPNTRRLLVRAEVKNPDRALLPNMFASFRIVSGESRLMPAIPQEAVVYDGAQARVWLARLDQRTLIARQIEVGDTVNGLIEVRKGLTVGESVVASGTLFIDRAARRD